MVKINRKAFSQFGANMNKQIEATKQSNIEDIIAAVSSIEDEAVFARLEIIKSNERFAASLEVSNDAELKSLCNIRCSKSGAPLQNLSIDEVATLLDINGKSRVVYMLKQRAITAVANKWLFTDEQALDALTEHDPRGYFVYAASRILRCFHGGFNQKVNQFQPDDTDAHYSFICDKSKLWDALETVPMKTIVQGNEIMRRYLSFINTAYAMGTVTFTRKSLATINPSEFVTEVQASIAAIIWFEFGKGRIKSTVTYADVVDLKLTYHGHSNFRGQRNLRNLSDTDLIVKQLSDFMKIDPSKHDVSSRPWQIREVAEKAKMGNNTEMRDHGNSFSFKKAATKPNETKQVKLSFAQLLKQSRNAE